MRLIDQAVQFLSYAAKDTGFRFVYSLKAHSQLIGHVGRPTVQNGRLPEGFPRTVLEFSTNE